MLPFFVFLDDFLDYLSSNGSFKVGKDFFIFTYNVDAADTHLVHYDDETKELKHLYSGVPSRFQTFYRADNRTVEIRSGMIFFLDDFEIMQFNNSKNLFEIQKKF
ncbi:hypothetical protein JXR93_14560 [bacterium]|nr:hypothetical protein [bacterium]